MIVSSEIKEKIIIHLKAEAAKSPETASPFEFWQALCRTIIELIADQWSETTSHYQKCRQAHYFSAEFLQGRSLANNLVNLGLYEAAQEAVHSLGHTLAELEEQEIDPALGNGGLGRLASCFLDSSATHDLPVTGYGILYRYGLFRQEIENGFQREYPDAWLERGYPFLIRQDKDRVLVHFQDQDIYAVPFDLPITGFGTANVNTLRLWRAEPAQWFDFNLFNAQHFDEAVVRFNRVSDICRVLYPSDTSYDGKVLRVRQQFFFVSASLQNIIRNYIEQHGQDLSRFAEFNSIQLNDTHPVIAIPELMRLLTEEHGLDWDKAWTITQATFAYTNHTILAEAMEKWDIGIYQYLFPWLVDILNHIDQQFRSIAAERNLNSEQIGRMAPLGDGKIRLAPLACFGSFSINGVAALHTQILERVALREFYQIWPQKFSNKTNGVTPRRWLRLCNPELSALLTELSGSEAWVTDLGQLECLAPYAKDEQVMHRLIAIKKSNKKRLADYLLTADGTAIDPETVFDVQIKRLHEYKRQLMNALLILDTYFQTKENPGSDFAPRTYLFGAKAAPAYFRAKATIKFINEIARLINRDPDINGRLRVLFIRNYNVTRGEKIFPAADISEQISTVGFEASGTGNMKFMMNGAMTIGTCDGANVEISEAVGLENCYIFGCKVEDFDSTKGYYNPQWQYANIPGLRRCVDTLIDGTLNDGGTGMFQDLYNGLLYGSNWQPADPFYVLGDFDEYRSVHSQMMAAYKDELAWASRCWLNIVHSGRFSSDRTISEYASGIWRIENQPVMDVRK
jgi:glycogen phosphorylase